MIIKKAEKTEDESFIPLHNRLKTLLDKYEWNLPRKQIDVFNSQIREVCKLAGFDKKTKEITYRGAEKEVIYRPKYEMASSHTARRTLHYLVKRACQII